MVLKKVALTGSSGMMGWHLIRQLISRGMSCIATSRRKPELLPPDSTWSFWDLREGKTINELDELFPQVEALIHLGAVLPSKKGDVPETLLFDANVRSTFGLGLWALARDLPMVFISTSTVYANPDRSGIREEDPKADGGRGGFYGLSKRLGEEILQYLRGEGLRICILRPSSVYGYGLPEEKMIPQFLIKASENLPIELEPPLGDKINLIHADDVAEAILTVLEKEVFDTFNIASPTANTVREIALTSIAMVGRGQVKVRSSNSTASLKVRFDLCCEKAIKAFGFLCQVDLFNGLQRMWQEMERARPVSMSR